MSDTSQKSPPPDNGKARRELASEITGKILAELDRGVLPWRKPWDAARVQPVLPRRANAQNYRGINVVMLWSAAVASNFSSPYWLTFKETQRLGGRVRKGERGESVIYYGQAAKTPADANGDEQQSSYRFLKYYTAFNADQIDNLPQHFYPRAAAPTLMAMEAHEVWFARLQIARVRTGDVACYVPSKDVIGMPPIDSFDTAAHYAATLNHEACHATMARHRLGRAVDAASRHGLAREELVAEIGASILGAHLGLPPHHIHDHASYIGHWMELLANDKRAFLKAAALAQAAVDWLLTKSPAPETNDVGA